MQAPSPRTMPSPAPSFTRRVLVTLGLISLFGFVAFVLWRTASVLLLSFGGILLAVFLDGLARLLRARLPLSRGVSLLLGVLIVAGVLVGAGFLIGPQLSQQLSELSQQIPAALDAVRQRLEQTSWGRSLLQALPAPTSALPTPNGVITRLSSVFTTLFGMVANVVVVLFVGLYVAASPSLYLRGVQHLIPPPHRARAAEVLTLLGQALRRWLGGQLASMTVVGLLTTIGLLVLGIPLALTLGLIAFLFSFVPYFGPIASVVPAALVALLQGPSSVVWVLGLYLGVQMLESYVVTPMIQKQAVSMPPALLILAQVLFGLLAGPLGIILAAPLAVAGMVLVQTLYVQDVLGDDITPMGAG